MTTMVRVEDVAMGGRRAAADRIDATNAIADRFFHERADDIARACQAMAGRFQQGARLFACGDGAQRSDVAHVVVEFVHPVVMGKRALPALSLPDILDGEGQRALVVLARSGDVLMVICAGALDAAGCELLATAQARGLLTIALTGVAGGPIPTADHLFTVPSLDPCIVQETHEMLYHVLWELVHVFFDQRTVSQ